MANKYVDPAAVGLNNGTSWTDAWTTMQSFLAVMNAGDFCYCRGSQALSTALTAARSGTVSSRITIIGCNGAGAEDGTLYSINANSVAANCITIATATTANYLSFRNIEFKNATGDGFDDSGTCSYSTFYNCKFSANGAKGTDGLGYAAFMNCSFLNNTTAASGSAQASTTYLNCLFINNQTAIDQGAADTVVLGCIIHNCSSFSLRFAGETGLAYQNIIDGGTTGIRCDNWNITLAKNRITNFSTSGIDIASNGLHGKTAENYFYAPGKVDITGTDILKFVQWPGDRLTAANSSDGYNDRSGDDFTLSATGDGVGVSTRIGCLDSDDYMYITQGLPPQYSGGGAKSASMRGGFING